MEKINKKLGLLSRSNKQKLIPLFLGLALLFATNTNANIITISDEETETFLATIIKPIFDKAGIPFYRNNVFIIEDNNLNAFVSDGNNLFINSGTILKAHNTDEIRGVIAHEAGHILGGHIIRHKLKQQELQSLSLASMLVAGALGFVSGRGDVAAAIAIGSQSSLLNKSLSYRVEEERSADEAAITLLKKAGYSPQGLLNFMKRIQQQNKMQGLSENGYFRTHPQTMERIAFLQNAVKNSSYRITKQDDENLNRIKAKLYAFVNNPQQTYRKYKLTDNSVNSIYARAIAAYKEIKLNKAINLINILIDKEHNNPHFRELKGQILMEQGKIDEAKKEFALSVKLMPSSSLFKINEVHSILESSPAKTELKQVISQLQAVLAQKQTLVAWLLLSRAYEMNGNKAEALYAAAEYSIRMENPELATKQAKKALSLSKNPKLNIKISDLLLTINNMKKH